MSEANLESAPKVKYDRKEKLFDIIKKIDLEDHQRLILKERWADQTAWYGSKARYSKKRRTILRVILIICGALIPGVPTITTFFWDNMELSQLITTILGITVALTAGLEAFFDYQDEYNRYREVAELMKIEGWSYFSLSGAHKYYSSHKAAFEKFCQRVEEIIRREIKAFSEAHERRQEEEEGE
jgi:hypothetical protein